MSRMAVLMLALSSPVALAGAVDDTGVVEDTGAAEDTDTQSDPEEEDGDDTETSDGSTSAGDDTGSTEDVPNGVNPEVFGEDAQNTGSSGSPDSLSGVEEPTACGGSMALLLLPLLGWRYRGS